MAFPTFTKLAAVIWPVAAIDTDKAELRTWGLESETALNALFSRFAMINGEFDISVAANALTIALKTQAAADPSTGDPVYIPFRGVSQGGGDEDVVKVGTATSLVISAGSTLGFVDGEAGRMWIVAFNDGGTVKLGAVNLLEGADVIHPLSESDLATSTDEGGAGAADTAGVIYTSGAISAKPMRILGFLTWEANALATAGLYANVPDVVQLMGPGVKRPGEVVQSRRASTAALDTTTTVVPINDTIPQLSTEGETQLTRTITPTSRANLLKIKSTMNLALSVAGTLVSALHQDSIENALLARSADVDGADDSVVISLNYWAKSLSVSSIDYKINNGPSTGTLSLNGINAVRTFGGVNISTLEVEGIFI